MKPITTVSSECPLVFSCDGGYAMQLATALRSVTESNRRDRPLEIYILSSGFSEETKQRIAGSLPQGSVSLHWVPVELSAFAAFSTIPHISTVTYARFLISTVLPDHVRKILYLDADLLVLDDLAPVRELDLQGAVLGAVVDERLTNHIRAGGTSIPGLPVVHDYFNAGVLVVDLERWRDERISEKAMNYMKDNPHSPYSDQDALNVACDGHWKRLDSRWNYYQIDLKRPLSKLDAKQLPGIIHFQGWSKPWDAGTLNQNAAFYDAFRARTLFSATIGERIASVPVIAWALLKKSVKRSAGICRLWRQIRSFQSASSRDSVRRVPHTATEAQPK